MQSNQTANRGLSLIQDCGYYSSSCGYCKDEDSSVSTGKSAHGMHAHRLTVYDYQELLDQGWRRSGKFLYKPDNEATCCRQYTIRLDVTDYQPSKAHKKLLRKWDHFLAGTHPHTQQQVHQQGAISTRHSSSPGPNHADSMQQQPDKHSASPKRARTTDSNPAHQHHHQQQQQQHVCSSQGGQVLDQVRALLQRAVSELQSKCDSGCSPTTQLLPAVKVTPITPPQQQQQQQQQQPQQPKHRHHLSSGTVATSPCAHALAAIVRKHMGQKRQNQPHRQQQQQQDQHAQGAPSPNDNASVGASVWVQPEQLAQGLAERFNALLATTQALPGMHAAATKGHINILQQNSTDVQQQQAGMQQPKQQQPQQHVSRDDHDKQQTGSRSMASPGNAQQQQQQQQEQSSTQQQQQQHTLEVRMVPNQFIQEEFLLWQRYQAQQHHEPLSDLTPQHYRGFLVDTPLIHVQPPAAAGTAAAEGTAAAAAGMPSCGYGSFHQQYWLDGKLVAVGVVDVLPRCLSSKYFFWDPDYAWLSLGRYGALREISWVAAQHTAGASDLRYYYLGFYIHTCPKMAYKAEYCPSELLCPKRQVWVGVDDIVRAALDAAPYVVLSQLPGVRVKPNLSVPRQLPPAAAAAAAGVQEGASSSGAGAVGVPDAGVVPLLMPEHLSIEQQLQQRQRDRAALDAQQLFVMKQPVRWGALRASGLLSDEGIGLLEERLTAWRAVVGETARTLLYATSQDVLMF